MVTMRLIHVVLCIALDTGGYHGNHGVNACYYVQVKVLVDSCSGL